MTADSWIERVRAADAEAEAAWEVARNADHTALEKIHVATQELVSIAAELRAQRIARRPGAGA